MYKRGRSREPDRCNRIQRVTNVSGDTLGSLAWNACPPQRLLQCVTSELEVARDVREKSGRGWNRDDDSRSFLLGHLVLRAASTHRLALDATLGRRVGGDVAVGYIRQAARLMYDAESSAMTTLHHHSSSSSSLIEFGLDAQTNALEYTPVTYACSSCFGPLGCYALSDNGGKDRLLLCAACYSAKVERSLAEAEAEAEERKKKKKRKSSTQAKANKEGGGGAWWHFRLIAQHDCYHGGLLSDE